MGKSKLNDKLESAHPRNNEKVLQNYGTKIDTVHYRRYRK